MPSPPDQLSISELEHPQPLDGRSPVLPVVIDLSEPIPTLVNVGHTYRAAHCLVVVEGRPVGWVDMALPEHGVEPELVAALLWKRLRREIVAELADRGLSAPGSLPAGGFDLGRRDRRVAPDAAVVIATRERPEELERCLRSVLEGVVVPAQLVVVDNAPTSDRTERLVRRMAREHPSLVYVREPVPGLGRAHNAALPVLETRIAAFTDDDVVVHPWWLARVVEAFDAADDVTCVTGMIAPLELDTRTQQLIEAHAGFNKGLRQRIFDPAGDHYDDVLFPFAAGVFGSGANMSFDTAYLRSVGGFDAALGAGTVALGGDDLAAFYDVIATGHRLVYEPGAIVCHRHHRELDALRRQAYGYGAGLSAHLTRCVLNDPRVAWAMLRRVAPALRRAVQIARPERAPDRPEPPSGLTWHHLRGMAVGPVRYLRSRRADRALQGGATPLHP